MDSRAKRATPSVQPAALMSPALGQHLGDEGGGVGSRRPGADLERERAGDRMGVGRDGPPGDDVEPVPEHGDGRGDRRGCLPGRVPAGRCATALPRLSNSRSAVGRDADGLVEPHRDLIGRLGHEGTGRGFGSHERGVRGRRPGPAENDDRDDGRAECDADPARHALRRVMTSAPTPAIVPMAPEHECHDGQGLAVIATAARRGVCPRGRGERQGGRRVLGLGLALLDRVDPPYDGPVVIGLDRREGQAPPRGCPVAVRPRDRTLGTGRAGSIRPRR